MSAPTKDGSEVEITPEMIEVGRDILWRYDADFDLATDIAAEIFSEMWVVYLGSRKAPAKEPCE